MVGFILGQTMSSCICACGVTPDIFCSVTRLVSNSSISLGLNTNAGVSTHISTRVVRLSVPKVQGYIITIFHLGEIELIKSMK